MGKKKDSKKYSYKTYLCQQIRGLIRKYHFILERGGKCEICGYNKNLSALEFHHINPEEKSFGIDLRKFSNNKFDKLQEELNKCMLVCANCHREIHNPNMAMDNIPNMIEKMNDEKNSITYHNLFNSRTKKNAICPNCGRDFKYIRGKTFCSEQCRYEYKGYPSIDEIKEQYGILHNWEKVAKHFNLTRKIIQDIRKRFGILPSRSK